MSYFPLVVLLAFALCGQLLLSKQVLTEETDQCNALRIEDDPNKVVCVCNASSCKQLEFTWPQISNQTVLVTSSQSGQRFQVRNLSEIYDDKNEAFLIEGLVEGALGFKPGKAKVEVDLSAEFQKILGWGGAFTDAAGANVYSLSEERADQLIKSYYGDDGLQYNFGRVPIGGSDFSARNYTYDDTDEPDYELKQWSLAHEDIALKIPFIRRAIKLTESAKSSKDELKLFSSPWSPPKWMKTSNSLVKGHLKDDERVYKSYAEYLMKFYDAYKEHGINFWGATVQNEPFLCNNPFYWFNSLQLGSDQTIEFVSKYLGPALQSRNMTKENGFKLMVGDDCLGLINKGVPKIMSSPEVRKYVSGLAFHWYLSGNVFPYNKLSELYENIRDKIEFVIMSEACTGSMPTDRKKVDLGSWRRAEEYAADIIEDLNRQTSAWIDWNLALSLKGGPNWADNFVDSPIIVDAAKDQFYKQPMYYALAHFSRLFKPGSIRLSTKVVVNHGNLLATSVHNKETGHLILNILNLANESSTVELLTKGSTVVVNLPKLLTVEGRSIISIVVKL